MDNIHSEISQSFNTNIDIILDINDLSFSSNKLYSRFNSL